MATTNNAAVFSPDTIQVLPLFMKITNGRVAGGIARLCFTQGDQESGGLRVKMGFSGRHYLGYC